jgi:hypothetical protein
MYDLARSPTAFYCPFRPRRELCSRTPFSALRDGVQRNAPEVSPLFGLLRPASSTPASISSPIGGIRCHSSLLPQTSSAHPLCRILENMGNWGKDGASMMH